MNELCNLYKKFFSILIIVLTLVLVCPMVFGYTFYAIETDSMKPTILTGSIVYVEKISVGDLKLNDIITFERSNIIVTHRLVGIDEKNNQVITKGDGVIYNDEQKVSIPSIRGKVKYSIPFVGYALIFLKSIEGMIMAIILMVFFLISILLDVMKGNKHNEKD